MSSDAKLTSTPEPEAGSPGEPLRSDRRKVFVDALVGVPIILTLTSKPLWAMLQYNASSITACRYVKRGVGGCPT